MVTNPAMIKTKTGMRISFGIYSRNRETARLDAIRTIMVATPSARALITVPETASSGHKPQHLGQRRVVVPKPIMDYF